MGLKRIETEEGVFELCNNDVVIDFDDAESIRSILFGCGKPYFAPVVDGAINVSDRFSDAISKAESKKHPDPFPVNFDRDMKGHYPGLSKTVSALIDKVHRRLCFHCQEISEIKRTISSMQSVIDSMKGK